MTESPTSDDYLPTQKNNYKKVSQKAKQKLIHMVLIEGKKTCSVARTLRLNLSTAKMIILRQKRKLKIVDSSKKELPVALTEEQKTACEKQITKEKEEDIAVFVKVSWWCIPLPIVPFFFC